MGSPGRYYDISGVVMLRRRIGGANRRDWQVGTSVDDGHSSSTGGFDSGAINLLIGDATPFWEVWARWTGITIPQGATIDVAYITIQPRNSDLDGAGVLSTLYLEDSDDAVAPTTQAEHDADVRTTAGVDWDAQDFTIDTDTDSPSIATVVQEVVDRASWLSGNAMMLLWDNRVSDDSRRYDIHSYDSNPVKAIKLHVEWSS